MARILSGEAPRQTARWRFASARAIGVAVGATCVAATLEQVTPDPPTVDLTWSRAQTDLPSFDVASIKPNRGSDAPTTLFPLGPGDAYAATGGLFRAVNQPLIAYVRFAYRMGPGDELLNLPRWVSEERFDIQARTDTNPSKDQMRLLVRSLLMDRFGLGVHTEQRTQALYDLIVAERGRLGPQIRPHATDANCKGELVPLEADAPSASAPTTQPPSMFRGPFTGIDRHIRNRTGLSGTFDFSLEWSRQAEFASPDTTPGDTGPRFAEALRTQLGLTLRSARGPVDVLVIDRIDRPTAD
ncbi:MAG: TIGR03435 family protein [Micropepsaceae bacterium]